jgi:hypothetical protein
MNDFRWEIERALAGWAESRGFVLEPKPAYTDEQIAVLVTTDQGVSHDLILTWSADGRVVVDSPEMSSGSLRSRRRALRGSHPRSLGRAVDRLWRLLET